MINKFAGKWAWYDFTCQSKSGFICKKQKPTKPTKATIPDTTEIMNCEKGWEKVSEKKCIKITQESGKMTQMGTFCKSLGASLLSYDFQNNSQILDKINLYLEIKSHEITDTSVWFSLQGITSTIMNNGVPSSQSLYFKYRNGLLQQTYWGFNQPQEHVKI
jgi:hypothetical protein